ncbi:unnamed protein product [Musa acuminata subsp. burmannicoides]
MGNLNASLFLILALLLSALPYKGPSDNGTNPTDDNIPVSPVEHQPVAGEVISAFYGGVLAPFHVCSECQCCSGSDRRNCQQTKCCHRIVCSQPGKPFNYCSLKPISCGCANCN